jgi:hypothetical protein
LEFSIRELLTKELILISCDVFRVRNLILTIYYLLFLTGWVRMTAVMTARLTKYSVEGSTDIGGVSPWLAHRLWQRYRHLIDGLEVIAWKWSTSRYLRDSQQNSLSLPVTRLHGPMLRGDGRFRFTSMLEWYDFALTDDKKLLDLARLHDVGVLIHAPHAVNGFAPHLVPSTLPRAIWIENHDGGKKGLDLAVQALTRYPNTHTSVHLMLDVAHYIEPWENLENYKKRWHSLLEAIARLAKHNAIGVHLPVGDNENDSIDILDTTYISDMMLLELRDVLKYVDEVVLEYQSRKTRYALPVSYQLNQVWPRLDKVMERLGKAGIVG